MKRLSVLDIKEQFTLKAILLRVSLCSVLVSFHEYPVSSIMERAINVRKAWRRIRLARRKRQI